MNNEIIIDLIEASEMNQMQKYINKGFVARAIENENKIREDRLLVEQVSGEKKLSEVILSTDQVKIYTVSGKEDWDIKYPFRSIFLNSKGVWERSCTVSPTFDLAYLVYLEKKHLGSNSQFVDFACKTLEIKLD